MELTKSELEIMNVIWGAGRPLTRGEILDLSVDKNWKDNSIHILLNRLLAKGALAESGFARSGKSYGRLYEAKLTGKDYYAENVFYGGPERLEMLRNQSYEIYRDKKPHIGLDNIRQRLAFIYPGQYQFDIQSTEGYGTTISISIPLIRQQ